MVKWLNGYRVTRRIAYCVVRIGKPSSGERESEPEPNCTRAAPEPEPSCGSPLLGIARLCSPLLAFSREDFFVDMSGAILLRLHLRPAGCGGQESYGGRGRRDAARETGALPRIPGKCRFLPKAQNPSPSVGFRRFPSLRSQKDFFREWARMNTDWNRRLRELRQLPRNMQKTQKCRRDARATFRKVRLSAESRYEIDAKGAGPLGAAWSASARLAAREGVSEKRQGTGAVQDAIARQWQSTDLSVNGFRGENA
jgi:hypothetical protein